jgi:RimJ/RimL family protein N-acetyltransferase
MTLDRKRELLLAKLVENPETVISIHLLRKGDCDVYMPTHQSPESTAVLQPKEMPSEPTGFGSSADALWRELTTVKGWQCILVDREVAPSLGAIISSQLKTPVIFLDDVYHVPRALVLPFKHDSVRRLKVDDLALLEDLPREAQPIGFWGDLQTSLSDGFAVGAVVEGKIVATSFISARGQHYADIGIHVLGSYRQRGLGTAAASLVARSVQRSGLIPVWSCGSHNIPSLRLAGKLGFIEVSRRTYVIAEEYAEDVMRRTYPAHDEKED